MCTGVGSPRPAPAVLADRYELGPVVGHGGSAVVHRARDRLLGREVAVKVFTGRSTADRARQDRELRLLARMHHPHLVQLFDAGESDGRAFLVMELVDGPSLAGRLDGGPLPPGQVTALGADLARALDYVHERGVTHRDVKPGNVLLGDRPMLGDFGISLPVDGVRVTSSGSVVGTAAYMAPEQVRGDAVGPPADVYALGLVLIESLTGRPAFEGPAVEAAVARLSRSPALPPDVPADLGALLGRMTATDPGARPDARTVAALLGDRSPTAPALPEPPAPRPWRGVLTVVTALAVLAMLVGAAAWSTADGPAPAPVPASTRPPAPVTATRSPRTTTPVRRPAPVAVPTRGGDDHGRHGEDRGSGPG